MWAEDPLYEEWRLADESQRPDLERKIFAHVRRHAEIVVWTHLAENNLDLIENIRGDVLAGIRAFRGDARFSSWVHRIALNHVFKELKRRYKEPRTVVDLADLCGPDDQDAAIHKTPPVPVIELYAKGDGAERECDFVFTAAQYQAWLMAAREPLRSASILAHDGGICRGELLALQRDCVHLNNAPDERGFWGTATIKRGLKRAARKRDIPITGHMATVLGVLLAQSQCEYVFTNLQDHSQPLSPNTLADQHRAIMQSCDFHPDAGLHALRHTFLTEAGRHTQNVRALQKLAGHTRIETTMRYIHPDQEDVLEVAARVQEARNPKTEGTPATFPATTERLVELIARKQ